MPPIRAIAFDCYGTLLDFDSKRFIETFGVIAREQGIPTDGKAIWDHWIRHLRESAGEMQADPAALVTRADPPFAPYRETWVDHFRAAFEAVGGGGDPLAATVYLHRVLGEADAYPETRSVIDDLRGLYRLALVSNADDEWLYTALRKNDLDSWDVALSSEEVRAYKPHPAIFREALARLGLPPEAVLYVGDSPYADVLGARNVGMPVAWINRNGAKLPENVPAPTFTITSLSELPDLLAEFDASAAK